MTFLIESFASLVPFAELSLLSWLAWLLVFGVLATLLWRRLRSRPALTHRQLKSILDSTPDPVLVADDRNRLLLSNRAAGRALGLKSGHNGRQTTQELLKQRVLFDLLQASSPEEQSAEIELPDGRIYLATASTMEVDGRPAGRVCILRDVTHFKELDALKSDFVATVSHDLRSPLSLMRGYTSMLGTVGELNDQQREYVNKIIVGVENMSHLVNNLLDLGRIEAGVGLTVEHVGVLDILQRVTGALQHRAVEKDITLTIEMPKDMPHAVEADGALLDQALYNLVENAIKYTPQGGQVRVTTHSTAESVTFEIIDSGVGIAPEHAARLFEKFYRSPQRETRAEYGTGLGLAIVRSIAGRHAGQVWVESQPGRGSHFFLKVPLSHPQPGAAT
ncbi:MAG TPA: ATP-binding protein [Anaerolineales bacterium]|jgi:PAS domain S-box-containing protein